MTVTKIRRSDGNETIRGAVLEQTYVKRSVYVYPLYESEVKHLKSDSDRAAMYFALGGAAISFGVGILTNAIFADWATLGAEAKVAIKLLMPILALVGGNFLRMGYNARKDANTTLDDLKTLAEPD